MTIDENVPLKSLNTLKVGGEARYFCVVKNLEDIKEAAVFGKRAGVPILVLGGGSNVLISDQGFSGLVVKMAMRGMKFDEKKGHTNIDVAAGENWDNFVEEVVSEKLWGLENLSGIPGTVGASPVQNIGAYGTEVSSFLDSVEIFDLKESKERRLESEECQFGYRDSLFKKPDGKHLVITSVRFKLPKDGKPSLSYKDLDKFFGQRGAPKPILKNIREAVLKIRAEKFPSLDKFGTAGSFFKNPVISEKLFEKLKEQFPGIPGFPSGDGSFKLSLAWILDNLLNLKGKRMGNVGLYEKQPLVLVTDGDVTSHEVSVFADKIATEVKDKTGIDIEREVQSIGEDNPPSRYQTLFWTSVYHFWPKLTAFVQAFGIHKFRQKYIIGFLKKGKTPEEFTKHLKNKGYSKAYMAWKDLGEVLSLRKIIRKNFQYHIRLFEDGEIRGHYEYTAEANPLGHFYEVVFTDPKDYFEHLLHGYLDKS
ncbi:MAG: UDP-N-acetylenolpyruvoylglucosamine reductase [Candidatus Taylorbacteria bacterium RIFCSPLOWO2_02_FULL_43_11]|uniref:UDP-N-acetylenolpyruvoylglucosamine reductase n=1 Tax=Candidatus Taylorbacteria bacterium RIFCSPHIGHO2_02_FULL_43_32b TaxID=1802306 RepID=A0A1G2ME23_9BACT|nr:MAG: UDP-N-acetylenolpyruvoylglucosamine reductase [Candidatus Taylorbacteria bacterium RIFCSPHIGHO2_01_FULL_43_47]OHA22160.1 MAG: UDP-N-acetylenolpyruvoylglucosamine reductase [Candidatus Taylorbacteria bacterium RIFCSPHIGHO2_02_FULL_43_32b]OHA28856.1 MAG: UDP-N-acetylenolpyruvoylglucosamine reductase [Candidatus Taylorbacteria bacterium RIFCSPLOWO2_01_FULL_43_44]OHA36058.1 MAG: UDP-N-acetylenolpyruvoylglucosamine reductase [Candidatus Taylorbacteria bacterium RIFCSPLOWO2_02_FULL_43_11]